MTDASPPLLPLSVVFEGQSWKLTMLLHTTIALWLVAQLNDRQDILWSIDFDRNEWITELLFYLSIMALAILVAALAAGVLSLNVRPAEDHDWRRRTCTSTIALVLIDLLAVDGLRYAVRILVTDTDDSVVSIPATVFIIFVGIALVFGFNVMYVQMFGCCVCCRCDANAHAEVLPQAHKFNLNRHSDSVVHVAGDSMDHTNDEKCTELSQDPEAPPQIITLKEIRASTSENIDDTEDRTEENVQLVTSIDRHLEPHQAMDESMQRALNQKEGSSRSLKTQEGVNEATESYTELDTLGVSAGRISRGAVPGKPPPFRDLHKWNTIRLVEAGSLRVSTSHTTRSHIQPNKNCEIVVEEPDEEAELKGHLKKAVRLPDVLNIVQKFLRRDEGSGSFKFSNWSIGNLWDAVREEPGHFRYAAWIKSAFLTSFIVLIFTGIRTMSVLSNLSDLYEDNRDRFNSNSDEFDSFLTNAGWTDGISSITRTVAIELYFIVDAVVLGLRYTSIPGYLVGMLVGIWSLVAVLIQHKRISLAVSDRLNAFQQKASVYDLEMESPWCSFQKKYPAMGACFFLAILCSTAVVQLHIVGIVVAVLLGLAVNISKLSVLMDLFGFYILAYIIVFIFDLLVMRFLKKFLISSDEAYIKHPRWFNFMIVVLSMVHLVIGLLYALWRVLYLVVTTIIVLNRLDISLFTTGKSLDNGHNAFMSMLVLTVLIQEDQAPCILHPNLETNENASNNFDSGLST